MSADLKLVVGIGNPGSEYANTRHNAGFRVVDEVAASAGSSFSHGEFRAFQAVVKHRGARALLLKPLTFVNRTGESIRLALRSTGIDPGENLLVVTDDADLLPGVMRFARKGSSARHRGLEDAIRVVGDKFQRLRIGIGRDPSVPLRDYVLSPIPASEQEKMDEVFELAAQAVLDWLSFGIQYCQNHYNRKQPERSDTEDGLPEH